MTFQRTSSTILDICKALDVKDTDTVYGLTIKLNPDSLVEVEIVRYVKSSQSDAIVELLEEYELTPKLLPPSVDDH